MQKALIPHVVLSYRNILEKHGEIFQSGEAHASQ